MKTCVVTVCRGMGWRVDHDGEGGVMNKLAAGRAKGREVSVVLEN